MDDTFHAASHTEGWRVSKTGWFWLVLLIASNIVLIWWLSPTAQISDVAPTPTIEPSIRLISELSGKERDNLIALAEQNRAAVGERLPLQSGSLDPLVCRIWGPFSDATALESLQQQVVAFGSAVEVQASEIVGEPDYLVYIDTGSNLDNARRMLKELQSQSVDSYVIAGGDYVHSVSVGVFSRPERADAQSRKVSNLGYKAVVQPLNRSQTVYHLVARVPQSFSAQAAPAAECATIASIQ